MLGHLRFIPAYAGNSLLGFYRRSGRTVHPRLRGELFDYVEYFQHYGGSSPLTRGTLLLVTYLLNAGRFIPAYAGNSVSRKTLETVLTVHPRLRGEL